MPAIEAMDEVETGEASLLAEAPEASAAAEEAPALPAPRAFPLDRGALGRRRGAAASVVGLLLGCAAAALAVSALSGGSGESAASSKVSDSGVKLWGVGGGGGACGAQGCQCNCAWASDPQLCRPEANDGQCCWSCCCADHGNANGGYGYDGFAGGHGDAYHGSSYSPQRGYVHHTYAIHHPYYGHHVVHHFSVITIFWIILFIGLCLLGCVALYFYLKGKK